MQPSTFTMALFHQRIERRMEFPLDAPPAQLLCFGFQQLVQRFFYAISYQFLALPLISSSFSVTISQTWFLGSFRTCRAAIPFHQLPDTISVLFAQLNAPYL